MSYSTILSVIKDIERITEAVKVSASMQANTTGKTSI